MRTCTWYPCTRTSAVRISVIFNLGLFCGVVIPSTAADQDGSPNRPAIDESPPFSRVLRFSSCIINSLREAYTFRQFGKDTPTNMARRLGDTGRPPFERSTVRLRRSAGDPPQ